jgi:glycosyltransferase involved in cell wall biosynthesis
MMATTTILALLSFVFALGPAVLYALNVRLYRRPAVPDGPLPPVSILIPARNEERSIGATIEAALATERVEVEIVVLDDHSEDETASIVRSYAKRDSRVRLEPAAELPPGWCGKQHACFALSKLARHPVLCFLDADVCLAKQGLARMAGFLESSGADLVSGFPQQLMGTFFERLVIPLIQFLLLGFLPIGRMRKSLRPSFGAGCGQLFVVRREAYEKAGGHELVRDSLHDGITLPRAFRRRGFRTDLCDASDSAVCRMYQSGREVWNGLAKNAHEGLAAPRLIVPATLMLLLGQVLPLILLLTFLARFATLVYFPFGDFYAVMTAYQQSGLGLGLAFSSLATLAMYYPRFDAAIRFRQPIDSAIMHPLGIVALLAIQWYAFVRVILGRRSEWKGRSYFA